MRNITKKILFSLPWFSALSLHASADIPLSKVINDYSELSAEAVKHISSEIIDDYKGVPIAAEGAFQSDDDESDNVSVSTINIEEGFRKKLDTIDLGKDQNKKFVLQYATSALNDITFHELTEKLLVLLDAKADSKERFILDISYNGITAASAVDIQRWALHDAISYISINGNPTISKRNIKKICNSIAAVRGGDPEEKKEKVRQVLSKVVFLPSYYINTAKTKVKIYKELEEIGYLPSNWDLIQKEFYRIVKNAFDLNFPEDYFQDPLEEAATLAESD